MSQPGRGGSGKAPRSGPHPHQHIGGRSPGRIGDRAGTRRDAPAFGDATLLAVPHDSVPAVLKAAGAAEAAAS